MSQLVPLPGVAANPARVHGLLALGFREVVSVSEPGNSRPVELRSGSG